LTMDEKLDRILSELREVKARLSAIEEKVVGRTNETQMKLDKIIQEIFDNERLEKIRTGGPQPRAIQYGSRSGGGAGERGEELLVRKGENGMERFDQTLMNAENHYAVWREANPEGLAVNEASGDWMLHVASCSHLDQFSAFKADLLKNPKSCSDNLAEAA